MGADDRYAYDQAMNGYLDTQRRRVELMYVRHRAVFAEHLVAHHLPGADVITDPGHPWDITWPINGADVRIQVKCTGEHRPRYPDTPNRTVEWDIEPSKKMWDPEAGRNVLTDGHPCHVFVVCQHTGTQPESGWTYAGIATQDLPHGKVLRRSGFPEYARLAAGSDLQRQVRYAVTDGDDRHLTNTALEHYIACFDADARTALARVRDVTDTGRFVKEAYALGLVLRGDTNLWWRQQLPETAAGAADALRGVAALARMDHFAEGILDQALEDGTMRRLLSIICNAADV